MRKLSMLACVSVLLLVGLTASAQKGGPVFDQCYQDNNGVKYLRIASAGGQFELSDCGAVTLSGTGTLIISGDLKQFIFDLPVPGGFLKGRFMIRSNRADGYVWDSSINAAIYTLEDTKFKGNQCGCS